eukprot:6013918-Prymnesium_polylepis.1
MIPIHKAVARLRFGFCECRWPGKRKAASDYSCSESKSCAKAVGTAVCTSATDRFGGRASPAERAVRPLCGTGG